MILNGVEKSVVLLMSMNLENSSKVLKHLSSTEIKKLVSVVCSMKKVTSEDIDAVFEEFSNDFLEQKNSISNIIKNNLFKNLGNFFGCQETELLFNEESEIRNIDNYLKELNLLVANELFFLIKNEHLQVIAMIFFHINRNLALETLNIFDNSTKIEIILKISKIKIIKRCTKILFSRTLQKIQKRKREIFGEILGIRATNNLLELMEKNKKINILKKMKFLDLMTVRKIICFGFKFEDIIDLKDLYLKVLVKELNLNKLVKILKVSDRNIQEKFLRNMNETDINNFRKEYSKKIYFSKLEIEKEKNFVVHLIRNLLRIEKISIDPLE
ncbi:MAG: FliG C-terminal domain-containing protein [Buchnera aphidicola (Tetraneura sorini)]